MPRLPRAATSTIQRAAARDWLTATLADGEAHPALRLQQDATDAGINTRTLRRAADDLLVIRERVYVPDRGLAGVREWTWRLP